LGSNVVNGGIVAQTPEEMNPVCPIFLGVAEPIAVSAFRRKLDQVPGTIAYYERLLWKVECDHHPQAGKLSTEFSRFAVVGRPDPTMVI
jgi:hypothetical protein